MIDCNEWKTEKRHEYANMGESKTTRIMIVTVPHVTSGSGLRKFQADRFFVGQSVQCLSCRVLLTQLPYDGRNPLRALNQISQLSGRSM